MSRFIVSATLVLTTFAGLTLHSANAQNFWGGNYSRSNYNHGCGTSSYSNYSNNSTRGYDPYYTSRSYSASPYGNMYNTGRYGYGYDRQYPIHRAHNSHYGY
ncbi:MAG: hypothetical protein IT428_09430 [Planctomycetaceae bacterium]|nr:hypothetical protein [Planctomycetaceae bacterium]